MSVDLIGVCISFAIQAAIVSGGLIGFSILRPTNKPVYEPRLVYNEVDKKPPDIPEGKLYNWVKIVWSADESKSMAQIGLDAVMFLRFLSAACKYFLLLSVFSIPLMCLSYFADAITGNTQPSLKSRSLTSLTITNIPPGSDLFYAFSTCAWIFSFYLYCNHSINPDLVYTSWINYTTLRRSYFKSREYIEALNNRTLLFTGIPRNLQSVEDFSEYLRSLGLEYPPTQVLIGRDYGNLPNLVEKHEAVTIKLESVLCTCTNNYNQDLKDPHHVPNERPSHKQGGFFGLGGRRVDSIAYYRDKLWEYERQIYAIRSRSDMDFPSNSSAFVSFASPRQAKLVCQKLESNLLKSNPISQTITLKPSAKPSPDFRDIIWQNISIEPALKKPRNLLAIAMTVGLIIVWIPAQSLVGGFLGNLATLVSQSTTNSSVIGFSIFIQSLIAPAGIQKKFILVVAVFNILLPQFLRIISRLQGVKSVTGVERSSLNKFFVFQIIQLFSHFSAQIVIAYISPSSDSDRTLESFLKQFSDSSFYISFILTGATFYAIEIVQGAPLIVSFINRKFFSSTPREENVLSSTPKFQYLQIYGALMTAFVVSQCYSVVAPLIVIFTSATFGIGYFIMKYQIFYVYDTEIESGGIWWVNLSNLICASTFLSQVITFGALVVQGVNPSGSPGSDGKGPNIMVAFLPFFTIIFWVYTILYLKPRSELLDEDVETLFHSASSLGRVSNPAIIKDLLKVWVYPNQKPFLEIYYSPEFKDIIDYVEKMDPSRLNEVMDLENIRAEKAKGLVREVHHRPLSGEASRPDDTSRDGTFETDLNVESSSNNIMPSTPHRSALKE